MRQYPAILTPEFCKAATQRIAGIDQELETSEREIDDKGSDSYKDMAKRVIAGLRSEIRTDPDCVNRLLAQTCIPCRYILRVGGAAVTTRPCGLCGVDQGFGSTCTDALCISCASVNELCKHCAGDIQGRVERTDFPTSSVN